MTQLVRAFQQQLIDYAGIFPPSQLPVEEALNNFVKYQQDEESWKLNTFILSLDQAVKAQELILQQDGKKQIPLSITIPKIKETNFRNEMKAITNQLLELKAALLGRALIIAIEIPIPSTDITVLQAIAQLLQQLDIRVYCEIPILGRSLEEVEQDLVAIKLANEKLNIALSLKFRTGGITKDLFPTPKELANAILVGAKQRLPIKFTAGLHHPIRMYRSEVEDRMFGFVNVIFATLVAYLHKANLHTISAILSEEDATAFSITQEKIGWQSIAVDEIDVIKLREQFDMCFGSCSFDEPTTEFKQLLGQGGVNI